MSEETLLAKDHSVVIYAGLSRTDSHLRTVQQAMISQGSCPRHSTLEALVCLLSHSKRSWGGL